MQLLPSETAVIRQVAYAAPGIAVLLAALMVSQIRYPHAINQIVRGNWSWASLALGLLGLTTALALGAWAAPVVLAGFIATSPVLTVWRFFLPAPETTGKKPAIRRFHFRTRRADAPMPNGKDKPASLTPEKHRQDQRPRVAKSRKVRM